MGDHASVPVGKRRSSTRRIAALVAVVAVAMLAVTAALLVTGRRSGDRVANDVVVADAASPSAIVALPDGGFRYGERLTGRIREVDRRGRLRPAAVATLAVRATPGQRGLLGLAVDRHGTTFAAWTRRADGRLVVAAVAPGTTRLVWTGPPSADLANGGRLAFSPGGALVIGIGDLEQRELLTDPAAPNGKVLALDPLGRPDQRPQVISAGWNNPFAFTYGSGGELWLADNAPGDEPERLTRGDRAGAPQATTGRLRPLAPSALVALGRGRLGLCGYVSRTMREVRLRGDRPSPPGRVLVDHCAVAAAVLVDRRVAYADDDSVRLTRRPIP